MQTALTFLGTSSYSDTRCEREGIVVGVRIQHSGIGTHHTVSANGAVNHGGVCMNSGTSVDSAVNHRSTGMNGGVGVNRAGVDCGIIVDD